jgi:hypothetical protein
MINGVPQLEDLGDVAGKRVLVRCRLQRADPRRRHHRRPSHPGRAAHLDLAPGTGGDGHGVQPPGSAQGNARSSVLDGPGAGPSGGARTGRRAAGEPALLGGRDGQRPGVRGRAGRRPGSLRERRLRGVAPSARLHRGSASHPPRRPLVGCWRRRSRCSWDVATSPVARSSPSSAGPRCPTSWV